MDNHRNMNGIRRALTRAEAILLSQGNYPCPPNMRIPRGWVLSAAGVPVPPLPQGAQFDREVLAIRATMTEAELADPANAAGNFARWMAHFEERRNQALASTEGLEPVSGPMNRLGRMLWWSPEERTLLSVLYHIQDGNEPRLEYP
jgi:hypothetical protein